MPFASDTLRTRAISNIQMQRNREMTDKGKGGEGNREADRRYRKGVSDTVESTSEEERSKKARDLSREELDKARQAEEKGKSRARK
jgi:hypothetical protein